MSFKYKRLDKNDAAVLLIDHQTGLFNLVRDFEPIQFKNNVLALADSAKFFNLPTILTTSFDNGPNGPLLPEIIEMFPEAPLIRRPGQINAWDNEEFVAAVKKTGKKQLIIAGIVTDVCVAFAALSAVEAGYEVVERIKKHVARTERAGVMGALGGFGGMFDLSKTGVKEPVLISGTDGVGTKLMLAIKYDKHDTIGQDCVAMCVNDIIAAGAEQIGRAHV